MSSDMERFIIVVVINTLVAAGYLIWNRIQNKERPLSYISKGMVMILCPVLGVLYVFLGYIIYRCFFF